ncbi:hypothetical protein ACEQPO_29175 [Bacillus sp. SL00103]
MNRPHSLIQQAECGDLSASTAKLLTDQRQTMIFVEHVLDGVIEWMDRVILLDDQVTS